ncbi:hypothetical protein MVEN_01883800 [Mycena venus]|uniref:Uncharacterized protein n=1 Tax=Mycena venus TaxID=2733690 RepID=A0A8H6XJG8_9AGAR|nr:hypothetical protein MVEN_01883800 [Mycena venus]
MARSSSNNTSDSPSTEDLKLHSSEMNQPEVISILSDGEEANDDDITQMPMDTLAEQPQRRKPKNSPSLSPRPNPSPDESGSRSPSPSPVWCEDCGMQEPDSDDDPAEVQYENCKLWAHIACLSSLVDWNDPKVKFICERCRENPLVDLFKPGQIVLIPSPHVPNWRAAGVLWYPARFIECHKDRAGQKDEYEFRWLHCTDGATFNSAISDLPLTMQRTFSRTRKFCQEIDEVQLTENQMCTIRMPRYLDPAYQYHTNPTLTAIFNTAVPQVAEILAKFDTSHPVVEDYNAYFKSPGGE